MTQRPGGMFRIGEMRELIDIESAVVTLDSYGQEQRQWEKKYRSQRAKWTPTAGAETIRGRSVEAGITSVFTIRYQPGITPEMRVVHSSGTYGIGYVKPVSGGRRYIEIHCKQAVA